MSDAKINSNVERSSAISAISGNISESEVDVFDIIIGSRSTKDSQDEAELHSDILDWSHETLRVLCVSTQAVLPQDPDDRTMKCFISSLLEGKTTTEIAKQLGHSPSQVYRLVRSLMEKYQAKSRHQLLAKLLAPEFVEEFNPKNGN